jgi:Concanavalin A-like lectin/glucanases superfamily
MPLPGPFTLPGSPPTWRFPRPASPPPVPQQVPGLRLWLAADKILGLSGGAAVATWADASGRNNDAIQGTAAAQPTYQTNVINGLPVVRFDTTGTADWLNLATTDFLAATNAVGGITFFAVAKLQATAATTNDYLSIGQGTVGSNARMKAGQRAGTAGVWGMTVRRSDGDAALSLEDAADDTSWHVHAAVMDFASGAATLYVDGVQVASNPSLTTTGLTSATNALVAAVGARGDGLGEFWAGDIAELICYVGATAIASADRDLVTNYLLAKYAITAATAAGKSPQQISQYTGYF